MRNIFFVYQKALIHTFHTSFWLQTNLCIPESFNTNVSHQFLTIKQTLWVHKFKRWYCNQKVVWHDEFNYYTFKVKNSVIFFVFYLAHNKIYFILFLYLGDSFTFLYILKENLEREFLTALFQVYIYLLHSKSTNK